MHVSGDIYLRKKPRLDPGFEIARVAVVNREPGVERARPPPSPVATQAAVRRGRRRRAQRDLVHQQVAALEVLRAEPAAGADEEAEEDLERHLRRHWGESEGVSQHGDESA